MNDEYKTEIEDRPFLVQTRVSAAMYKNIIGDANRRGMSIAGWLRNCVYERFDPGPPEDAIISMETEPEKRDYKVENWYRNYLLDHADKTATMVIEKLIRPSTDSWPHPWPLEECLLFVKLIHLRIRKAITDEDGYAGEHYQQIMTDLYRGHEREFWF